jgi:hypothetical protein
MAQQSSREFASTDPTTRIEDAGFQVPGVSPEISLNSCSHLLLLRHKFLTARAFGDRRGAAWAS